MDISEENEGGVEAVIEVLLFLGGDANNDYKEESLEFGVAESGNIRMLGCWMSPKNDVSNRIKRANGA